jgi:hypothetical protein
MKKICLVIKEIKLDDWEAIIEIEEESERK